jgi:hypothetical protein
VVEYLNRRWWYIEHPIEYFIKDKSLLEKTFGFKNMGIDSCIYVLADEDKFDYSTYSITFLRPGMYKGLVNFEIEPYQRYYSKTYQRGHWPTLAKCLMELLADPHVQTVYYLPDHVDLDVEKVTPFGIVDLFELTAFYIQDNKLSEPY